MKGICLRTELDLADCIIKLGIFMCGSYEWMLRDHKILYTLKLEDSMHKFVAKIMCIEEIEN